MPPSQVELPTVMSYLERLPGGINAYPECAVKGSLLSDMLFGNKLSPDMPLPKELRALVLTPPLVSAWVPEVHFNALMIAVYDAHFGRERHTAYFQWIYDRNGQLLSTVLYRALFLVLSPERLLTGFEKRWSIFRRGTTVSMHRCGAREIDFHVYSPPHLYPALVVYGMSAALTNLVTLAGGTDVQVAGKIYSPGEVIYRITWR